MNFWNKNWTRNQDEGMSSSSNLLDVSAIDIPDSDQNDQYVEDVFSQTSNVSTSFDVEDETSPFPTIDHPSAPFMAPPIPKAPLSSIHNQMDMSVDEYEDLPPLEVKEDGFSNLDQKDVVEEDSFASFSAPAEDEDEEE